MKVYIDWENQCVLSDKTAKDWKEEKAEQLVNNLDFIEEYLNERYSTYSIWTMAESERDAVKEDMRDYAEDCVEEEFEEYFEEYSLK